VLVEVIVTVGPTL